MAPGEVAEWSNAPHSKCGIGASLSGVRIPPSPPVRKSVRLSKPFRSEGCHAKAHRAKAGCAARELRPGRPPLRSSRERQPQGRRGSRSQLKYRKQPHAKYRGVAGMDALPAKTLTRRANQRHHSIIAQFVRLPMALPIEIAVTSIHSGSALALSSTAFRCERFRLVD